MTDHDPHDLRDLRDLLTDAVTDVEPGHGLDEIRARTTHRPRPWLPVGLSALAVAAAVTAFAVLGDGGDPVAEPGPVSSPTATTSPEPSPTTGPSPTSGQSTTAAGPAMAVYYVGDTPQGPRLFREFRPSTTDDLLSEAVAAAVGRAPDDRPLAPLDPDYRSAWPAMTAASARTVPDGNDVIIEISLGGDAEGSLHDRGTLDQAEAAMAVEQLIYTAQAAIGERAPVQFLLYGERTDQVLGIPASEPLANGPALDTLALVNVTSPEQGGTVDGDTLGASGVSSSFEATVPWEIHRGGAVVLDGFAMAEGWMDRLYPWEVSIDVSDLEPGDYTFVARTDDPSGGAEGAGPHEDTKSFSIE